MEEVYHGTQKCVDCGKDLGHYQKNIKRCKPCSGLTRRGVANPKWKGGLPKCLDCGAQLSAHASKRCQPCYHKLRTGENHPLWNPDKPKCQDCGELIGNGQKSIRCWDCHVKAKPTSGENNHKWITDRPRCIDCGKEVSIRKRPKRCRPCHLKNGTLKGEDNPNWKGGVLLTNDREIHSQALTKWRRAVFRRDNHICRLCRVRGGKIQAHHIQTWSTCEELRFDVDNGVTLCKDCHLHIVHQGAWRNAPLNFWS